MTDVETRRAFDALNAVLEPLGTNLKHYMHVHRDRAIESMSKVLDAALLEDRKRALAVIEAEKEWGGSFNDAGDRIIAGSEPRQIPGFNAPYADEG